MARIGKYAIWTGVVLTIVILASLTVLGAVAPIN
jgi:hypothetical protein